MTDVVLRVDRSGIGRDRRDAVPAAPTPSRLAAAIDDEAIARICRRDARGLATLYDRYVVPVYALALRIVRHVADAEDVTQDVFTQVWTQASRYDRARGPVPAWMLVIARSRALDRLRRRGPASDGVVDDQPSTSASAIEVAVTGERARMARSALAALPVAERRALLLAYFGGMTQAEIAAETGTPIGTVKTRIRRGLSRLRAAIGGPPRDAGGS